MELTKSEKSKLVNVVELYGYMNIITITRYKKCVQVLCEIEKYGQTIIPIPDEGFEDLKLGVSYTIDMLIGVG